MMRILLLAAAATLLCAAPSNAQEAVAAPKQVRGVVSRLVVDTTVPVPGAVVVLHRIGDDSTGVLDSARTNSAGEFRIIVRPFGMANADYMLTSSRQGVAYVAMLGKAADLDSVEANITVFDTTTAAVPVTTLERFLVVLAPTPGGRRRVVEVFQIANDSSVTRVSSGNASPVWQTTIPPEAADFAAGFANANPHSLKVENGEVRMYAPLAPGIASIEYSYSLPLSAFPLKFSVARATESLGILLEESEAAASGVELRDEGLVNIAGKNYHHRYAAANTPEGLTVTITVPEGAPLSLANYLLIVVMIVGVGMLVALALTFRRRAPVPAGIAVAPRRAAGDADTLARRIAELDDVHASRGSHSDETTAAYNAERARLKRKLAALLARGEGPL